MIALETKLAPAIIDKNGTLQSDYWSRIYNVYAAQDLLTLSPVFPLEGMLEAARLTGSPAYVLAQPAWLERLNALYTQENVEGFKAMLLFDLLTGASGFLDQASMDISNRYDAIVFGVSGTQPLEDINYSLVNSMLTMPVGRMYVDACLTEETRRDIRDIIDEAVGIYRARLARTDWLTDETRQRALLKLDRLASRIGYPDSWEDTSELTIDKEDSFLEATCAIIAHNRKLEAAKVGGEVDKDIWTMGPQTVNAFYDPSSNSINILAGILGGAYYTPGGAREVNLAGVGVVIGHEITHAFDESGSQFDEEGNMASWWTDADRAAFLERTDKVSAYYSGIETLPGMFVDGSIKVNEAVADLGGLSCMLEIARGIDDFDYALFFETYAGLWRMKQTREKFEVHLLTNSHPESYLRTNIGVQQFEEFYQAFDVRPGDGMYLPPQARLSVW